MDVKVQDKISRSRKEVFEAIKLADKLSGYFVSSASNDIIEGVLVKWEWNDYNVEAEINVKKVKEPEKIIFTWPSGKDENTVTIMIKEVNSNNCLIEITESSFDLTEEKMKIAMDRTGGWMHFICALKAYLYTGINLRK